MIEGSSCTAAGFQYQRGPRIGILIKGSVSNKRELSVKYGVRVRHTTTTIITRIKKKKKRAAQTNGGSFSWDCPLLYEERHGRKRKPKKAVYFVVKMDRAKVTLQWWHATYIQTPKCVKKYYTSEKGSKIRKATHNLQRPNIEKKYRKKPQNRF